MYTYPVPYLAFLAHYHIDHDYFECHEVLEEYWKKTGRSRHSVWVGLIQSAVCLYHYRRGNITGAVRMAQKSIQCFEKNKQKLEELGIQSERFVSLLAETIEKAENGMAFSPIQIPIADQQLVNEVFDFTKDFAPQNDKVFLANKHILRDRTDVLQEREAAVALKKAGKVTL